MLTHSMGHVFRAKADPSSHAPPIPTATATTEKKPAAATPAAKAPGTPVAVKKVATGQPAGQKPKPGTPVVAKKPGEAAVKPMAGKVGAEAGGKKPTGDGGVEKKVEGNAQSFLCSWGEMSLLANWEKCLWSKCSVLSWIFSTVL